MLKVGLGGCWDPPKSEENLPSVQIGHKDVSQEISIIRKLQEQKRNFSFSYLTLVVS